MKRFVGIYFVDDVEELNVWPDPVAPSLSARRGKEGEAKNVKFESA
ncbi:MAG: hypothetical protein KF746_09825 [Chitinophagaceae bacterium]|nr:hypothetical protein [Chitinophagaceae bacterium]